MRSAPSRHVAGARVRAILCHSEALCADTAAKAFRNCFSSMDGLCGSPHSSLWGQAGVRGLSRSFPSTWRLLLCSASLLSSAATAQLVETQRLGTVANPNEVLARPRLDYDPAGMKVGGFTVVPSVTGQLSYDDNIFGSDVLAVSDHIVSVVPQVTVRSNWSSHHLTLSARGQIDRFLKHSSQNSEQVDLTARGGPDISRALQVNTDVRYGHLVEPRGSLGDAFIGGTPVIYDVKSAGLGAVWQPAALQLSGGASIGSYQYSDIRLNDAPVSQSYRDRTDYNALARAGYALSPALALFVSGAANRVRYQNRSSGFDLNSSGYSVLAGADFNISKLIVGSVGAGYLAQSFADPRVQDVAGLGFNGRLTWNPTPLAALTLAGSRSVEQAGLIGVAGVIQRKVSAALDYEVLRNALFHADISQVDETYRGIDRRDSFISPTVSARYLVSRGLNLALSYQYVDQSSDGVAQRAYSANRLDFSVTVQR